jgi:hypothetical protein
MRLILLILSFFVALSVFSQVTVGSQYYQILRRSDKIDRILHDSVLGLPKKPAVKGIDTGAIYYRLTDSSILVWTGSQWRATGAAAVDSIWRVIGKDSIFFRKNGTTFAIKDSTGGIYTAGNGLTLSGSEFRLGGTLSVNTQIISPFLNDFTLTTRGSSGDNNRSDLLMQNGSLFAYGYSGGSPNRTISISSSILQMATDVSSAYLGAPNIYFQSGFSSGAAYAQTTTDTTTFKPLVLNTSTGLVSRMTSWPTGGSTPNLQAVLDAGSNLTNGYTISSIEPFTIQSTDGVNVGSLLTDVGSASIFSSGSSNTSRIDVIQDSLIFKPHLGRISIDTFAVRSTDTTINKPITYNISTKRMEYLQGWPTGGISDTSLPSQTGNNGKYLTTNGTSASWGTPPNFANTNLTLTGNRTHNAAGNDLTFTNLSYWDNFSTERFYFEGSDGTSTGTINTGKTFVGLSRTTTGGKNSYIAINQNGGNEFQIGAYRTGANSNFYVFPDSISYNKPIHYSFTDTTGWNDRTLITKGYLNQRLSTGSGSLNLQQVVTNGNTFKGSINLLDDFNNVIGTFYDGGGFGGMDFGIGSNFVSVYGEDSGYIYFNRQGLGNLMLKPTGLTGNRTVLLPNASGTLPLSIRLNGTTYTSNDTGLVDLGTITGGISDTSRIVTTDKTQSITGRKTFNAATFINKDSLPITTGKRWGIVVDTPTNQLQRQDLNIYRRDLDTIPLATFTVGSAAAGDTAAFSTDALAGSFYLDGTDTLFVTSYRVALQGTTPSITPEVWFNDSLNVTAGGTRLATGSAITNTVAGTSVTATTNKIPQGNWVFVRFSAVATKPTYFTLTLFGYRIRKA